MEPRRNGLAARGFERDILDEAITPGTSAVAGPFGRAQALQHLTLMTQTPAGGIA